jgi:hypothetical protein
MNMGVGSWEPWSPESRIPILALMSLSLDAKSEMSCFGSLRDHGCLSHVRYLAKWSEKGGW